MFFILHLLALFVFWPALFVTIPLHIMASSSSRAHRETLRALRRAQAGRE